jgi:HAD superfamily hydrolase (TIGR01509 family)
LGIAVDYSRIAGLKTMDAMRQCLKGAGIVLDEDVLVALVTEKQQCVRQMIGQSLMPLPGVDAFLRWARPRFKLAMVTSGSFGTVNLALERLGYTGWFNPLICADDVVRAKPEPEGFLRALQLAGVSAAEALVYEDSEAGFQAAALAGLCMGSSQSCGRALAGLFAPPERVAEFFGLWTMAVRIASIIGPLSYGLVTWATGGNHRLAILSTGVFFAIGLLLLARVDVERGSRAARSVH